MGEKKETELWLYNKSFESAKQENNNADAANSAWQKHNEIERGNPVRKYEGEKFKRVG